MPKFGDEVFNNKGIIDVFAKTHNKDFYDESDKFQLTRHDLTVLSLWAKGGDSAASRVQRQGLQVIKKPFHQCWFTFSKELKNNNKWKKHFTETQL